MPSTIMLHNISIRKLRKEKKSDKLTNSAGPQINNPNPYNIPSPYGTAHISHIPVAADDPIREQPYSNNPQNRGAVIQSSDIPDVLLSSISAPSLNWSTVAEAEEMKRLMKRHNGKSNHSTRSTSYSSRVPQYYKQLRAINSLTTNLFNGARDPVSVLNDNLYQNEGTSSDDRNPRYASSSNLWIEQKSCFQIISSQYLPCYSIQCWL
ncbi:hypothetical protein DICVIV_03104 [Dictyocaulus viviparus]|uniref:Uncharacterized protein n=1 Tax=Dictyocaulus viviparus TaxID=29172 RepID=A0A0D8Y3L7_DICVI|nr:hypothetical protein DICVIV_03104 [Dictyocaulus viviparus]